MSVQSITWAYPEGDAPATEDEPLVSGHPVAVMEELVQRLEHATVLRFGMLYGPGTWYAPGGRIATAVTAGQYPATAAITSFVHVDDAVAAVAQSVGWADGVYHVVDDEPAPATEWLPVYAAGIGAPAPQTEPLPQGAPVGRIVSNGKAWTAGWTPAHPTWRESFARPQGELSSASPGHRL
jgi:nucleoside-diphosphate-sugar epimerase